MKNDIRHAKQQACKKAFILLLSTITVLLCLVVGGVQISRALYKPVIGFLDVPENVREAIEKIIITENNKSNKSWKSVIIDPSLKLPELNKVFKKTDILITKTGARAEALASVESPNQKSLLLIPTTIRSAAILNNRQYGIPILLDHFELAWDSTNPVSYNFSPKSTLKQLEQIANNREEKTTWPFMCAGADDESLLSLIGALTEVLGSETAWESSKQDAKTTEPVDLVRKESFSSAIKILLRWRREGLLHPEWFRMTNADVEAFMETGTAPFVFMSLSNHRKIKQRTIEKYNSVFIPGLNLDAHRSLTIPSIVLITPIKKRVSKESIFIKDALLNDKVQTQLSIMTGLAPASSSAAAPDRQANEARLWAAASERPLPSFFTALYPDPADTALFAKQIRELLQTNGAEN